MYTTGTVASPTEEFPDMATRAVRSGGAMLAAKSIRYLFLVLVNFILINLLLPADFGMIRYVLLVVGIANILNEMGLTTAIVQRKRLGSEQLWSLVVICTLWGWLLYCGIFILTTPLSRFFGEPALVRLLRVGALMIPVTGISAVHRAWMRRTMRFGTLAVVEGAAAVVSAVVSVSMALSGCGVWSIVAGYLLFEGTVSIVLITICRIPFAPLQPYAQLQPVLFFGMVIIISRVIDYLLGNAPFILIGKVIGKEGLGLFSVAHGMAIFPQMAINAVLGHVMLSMFSRLQGDDGRIAAGFGRLQLFGPAVMVPVLLLMALMPGELLRVISFLRHNDTWLQAVPLLRWLALMGIMYVATTFSNAVWLSLGKVKESIAVSIAMFCTIIVAIGIGVRWGVEGICVALLVRSLVVFPVYVHINYRLTGIAVRIYYRSVLPPFIAGSAMAATVLAVQHFSTGVSMLRLSGCIAGAATAGTGVYFLVFRLFFRSSLEQIAAMVAMLLPGGRQTVSRPPPVSVQR